MFVPHDSNERQAKLHAREQAILAPAQQDSGSPHQWIAASDLLRDWGVAQFTDVDLSLSVRALLAVGYWAIGVAGGALAYRGFSNALPPKKMRAKGLWLRGRKDVRKLLFDDPALASHDQNQHDHDQQDQRPQAEVPSQFRRLDHLFRNHHDNIGPLLNTAHFRRREIVKSTRFNCPQAN
jgi:hypothetical protein